MLAHSHTIVLTARFARPFDRNRRAIRLGHSSATTTGALEATLEGELTDGILRHAEDVLHGVGGVAFDDPFGDGVGAADFTEHTGAAARCAFLGQWIEFNQAKTHTPSLSPLEIVC